MTTINRSDDLPIIAISVGCPSGIGPEVAVLAAARMRNARCVLVGDEDVLRRAAKLRRVPNARLKQVDATSMTTLSPGIVGFWGLSTRLSRPSYFGHPTAEDGAAQLAWINEATDLVCTHLAHALVTGPVSKHAIANSGGRRAANFLGHTEHLGRRLHAREVTMAFVSDQLVTGLVTTHIPLMQVAQAITPRQVSRAACALARLLQDLGRATSRIAIAALNPHAGEGGLLGHEEQRQIAPGVVQARRRLLREELDAELVGPLGAETAFRLAKQGVFDGVLAMYHDQATIPMKLLGFGEAVNVTVGLPIVRTSVDHGTAYDLAGSGRASARGMSQAISLAVKLVNPG